MNIADQLANGQTLFAHIVYEIVYHHHHQWPHLASKPSNIVHDHLASRLHWKLFTKMHDSEMLLFGYSHNIQKCFFFWFVAELKILCDLSRDDHPTTANRSRERAIIEKREEEKLRISRNYG